MPSELPSEMVEAAAKALFSAAYPSGKWDIAAGSVHAWNTFAAGQILQAAHVPDLLEALRWYADEANWQPPVLSRNGRKGMMEQARAALQKVGVMK